MQTKDYMLSCYMIEEAKRFNNKIQEEDIFQGVVNLLTGEVKLIQPIWKPLMNFVLIIPYEGEKNYYKITHLGGRHLITDYKNQPLFKEIHLFKKLHEQIQTKNIGKTNKI